MYYADLSPYTYSRPPGAVTLNIGWLDAQHAFPTGQPTPEFLDALFVVCSRSTNMTRGFHDCEFCDRPSPIVLGKRGIEVYLGDAEIYVPGADGRWYAAPNLIYHYVEAHRYEPPREFADAVLRAASLAESQGG